MEALANLSKLIEEKKEREQMAIGAVDQDHDQF